MVKSQSLMPCERMFVKVRDTLPNVNGFGAKDMEVSNDSPSRDSLKCVGVLCNAHGAAHFPRRAGIPENRAIAQLSGRVLNISTSLSGNEVNLDGDGDLVSDPVGNGEPQTSIQSLKRLIRSRLLSTQLFKDMLLGL